jgi:actin
MLSANGLPQRTTYVGAEAYSKLGLLNLTWPVDRGVVVEWSAFERLVDHTLSSLQATLPAPVFLTEAPGTSAADRVRTGELMFEKFNASELCTRTASLWALYAAGKETGCVVDFGEHECRIVPIYKAHVLLHAVTRLPVGGSQLLQFLRQLLTKNGQQCTVRVAQQIKETMLQVSRDGAAGLDARGTPTRLYQPNDPDDGTCAVDGAADLCCQVPEALFRPSLLGLDAPGLVGCIAASMALCDLGVRGEVFGNVVLCGGLSQLPNLRDRLTSELCALMPDTAVDVTAPREGSHSAWIGGSIVASSNRGVTVSRKDWAEQGSAAILRMSPDLN